VLTSAGEKKYFFLGHQISLSAAILPMLALQRLLQGLLSRLASGPPRGALVCLWGLRVGLRVGLLVGLLVGLRARRHIA